MVTNESGVRLKYGGQVIIAPLFTFGHPRWEGTHHLDHDTPRVTYRLKPIYDLRVTI